MSDLLLTLDTNCQQNQTVLNQLDRLNEDFAPHSISFKHSGTTHSVRPEWSIWRIDIETALTSTSFYNRGELPMRRRLRKGTYTTLNVFILAGFEYNVEGLCYPPRDVFGVSGMTPDEEAEVKNEMWAVLTLPRWPY